jgi:hypothetical protein
MTSLEIVIDLKINLVKYIFFIKLFLTLLMGLRMLQKRFKFNFLVFWGATYPMMKF